MSARKKYVARKVQKPQNIQDDSTEGIANSQSSEKNKLRSKNYSADESAALIKCCEKYHSIISKNSNRDKERHEKNQAWEKIKTDFDEYCRCQGIRVSKK